MSQGPSNDILFLHLISPSLCPGTCHQLGDSPGVQLPFGVLVTLCMPHSQHARFAHLNNSETTFPIPSDTKLEEQGPSEVNKASQGEIAPD